MNINTSHWIAVDWGTSSLRIWIVDDNETVVSSHKSEHGMSSLKPSDYEPTLISIVEPWLKPEQTTAVVICGMAGARQGWCEAPYSKTPCSPLATHNLLFIDTADPRIHVAIIPGLCQQPTADVIRGEETQIAGFIGLTGISDARICLPGTHSKWVTIKNKLICGFTTYMTGELFSIISNHSILAHSVDEQSWQPAEFVDAVQNSYKEPAKLTARLFSIRAESLLSKQSISVGRSRLSGLLLGVELNAACQQQDGEIFLIGDSHIASLYATAMDALSIDFIRADAEDFTLNGLKSIYQSLSTSKHYSTL